jgi:hypothetical protein
VKCLFEAADQAHAGCYFKAVQGSAIAAGPVMIQD